MDASRPGGEGRWELARDELDAVVAHSEAYFRTLPLRLRFAVVLVLGGYALTGLRARTPEARKAVYDRWFAGSSYLSTLLGQVLHLTFVGSVYSLPRIQREIGAAP